MVNFLIGLRCAVKMLRYALHDVLNTKAQTPHWNYLVRGLGYIKVE